jgi:hypothetical protein
VIDGTTRAHRASHAAATDFRLGIATLTAFHNSEGRLLSIAGKHLRGGEIVAARRRNRPHGPIAHRLWRSISQEASALRASIAKRDRQI